MPTNEISTSWLKSNEVSYSLKVWLTCLLLGPIVFTIVLGLISLQIFIYFFFSMLFYGLIYSIPSLVLFYAVVTLTNRTEYPFTIKKGIFIVAGIALAVLPFYLYISGDGLYEKGALNGKLRLSYFIAVLPGLLFYKRPLSKAEMEATGDMEEM